MKDPHEVLVPSSNLIFINLHGDKPEECTSLAPLADIPLYLGYGSA